MNGVRMKFEAIAIGSWFSSCKYAFFILTDKSQKIARTLLAFHRNLRQSRYFCEVVQSVFAGYTKARSRAFSREEWSNPKSFAARQHDRTRRTTRRIAKRKGTLTLARIVKDNSSSNKQHQLLVESQRVFNLPHSIAA